MDSEPAVKLDCRFFCAPGRGKKGGAKQAKIAAFDEIYG